MKPPATEPKIYGKTDLTYNDYLKVPELLELQKPLSEPSHHDEMLFIIIHQAYELWFKLVLHELDRARGLMQNNKILQTRDSTARVVEILKLLVKQIHILETMKPVDFLQFRDRLNPASGFQSLQFREVEFVCGSRDRRYLEFFKNRPEMISILEARLSEPDLLSEFYNMLRRDGYPIPENAADLERSGDETVKAQIKRAILPIYQEPDKYLPLYMLSESLVEIDAQLSFWREHHVRVVERVIGFKRGTGGSSGVEYLRTTTSKKCFPCLWEVRTDLTIN